MLSRSVAFRNYNLVVKWGIRGWGSTPALDTLPLVCVKEPLDSNTIAFTQLSLPALDHLLAFALQREN